MDKKLIKDLKDHIKGTTQADQLDGIFSMCLSIVELSLEQGLKGLSVGLPPFMTWEGNAFAPVEAIIKEWDLRPFIDRAREENKTE